MTNIAYQNVSPIPSSFKTWSPDFLIARAPAPLTRTPTPTEKVTLSAQAQQPNLFEGFSDSTASVKVDSWGKGDNDCLERILRNQGYSNKEIYAVNAEGQNLLERVASANNIKNPNLIRAGADLKVPSKQNNAKQTSNDLFQAPTPTVDGKKEVTTTSAGDSDDGFFETTGHYADKISNYLFQAPTPTVDGKKEATTTSAGDSDDGFFETTGHYADKIFNYLFQD